MTTAVVSAPDTSRPRLPTLHDIGCQVKSDLFGKDVQDTPTVSYAWIGDQFGHFALGFELTFLFSWILTFFGLAKWPTILIAPLGNFAIFVIKEASDYVTARSKSLGSKSDFKFDNAEILWNIVTALFYIGLGIVVAGAAIVLGPWQPVAAVAILILPALGVGVWWLRRKITFQQANLPCLYRLAIFPNYLGQGAEVQENVAFIDELIDPKQPAGRHLVIAGPPLAGKSSLATGVGTEFAFNMGIGRYTTLIKLLQSEPVKAANTDSPGEFQDGRILWPWEYADLLIVDDVDYVSDYSKEVAKAASLRVAGATAAEHAVDPIRQIEEALRRQLPAGFLDGLKARRSVWVVGDGSKAEEWAAMIRDALGVADPAAVRLVHLRMTVLDALKKKGAPIAMFKNPNFILKHQK